VVLKIKTLRKADQKYMESFETWCWRRLEKIIWNDLVRNEVLHKVKEDTNNVFRISTRNVNMIRHILPRKCLLEHVIEGKIERGIEVSGG